MRVKKPLFPVFLLAIALASCSSIIENMLQKPTDASLDQPQPDTQDSLADLDADSDNDAAPPDVPPADTLYEVSGSCFTMGAVDLGCDVRDPCQNSDTPGCGEKCDQYDNNRNADGCDPRCFFETRICTWAGPFLSPMDIVAAGNMVLVADAGDHTIRMVNAAGENDISLVAGVPGQPGSDNGEGSTARFSSPSGIELFGSDYVIVVDTGNNKIRKILIGSVTVSDLAGEGTPEYRDGPCPEAQFKNPVGIAVDDTTLYIADTGNMRIRKITDPLGEELCAVTTIAGPAGLERPMGIAWNMIDPNHLYATDAQLQIILRIDRNEPYDAVVIAGSPSVIGPYNDRAQGSSAFFNAPAGIDSNGEILVVAEKQRKLLREIELFSPALPALCDECWVTRLAGEDGRPGCQDGAAASLGDPTCVAFDKTVSLGMYRVFFCDPGCGAVRIVK